MIPLSPEQLGAYFVLSEVGDLLRHGLEQQLREAAGLSLTQFQILMRLGDAPGSRLRMTDLADGLVHSRSGLTYQAAQLEKAGLVTRTAGEDDERSVTVTLSPAGREAVGKALPGHVDLVRQLMIDALDPEDVATLTSVLGKVRDRMRAAPPRSAAPRAKKRGASTTTRSAVSGIETRGTDE